MIGIMELIIIGAVLMIILFAALTFEPTAIIASGLILIVSVFVLGFMALFTVFQVRQGPPVINTARTEELPESHQLTNTDQPVEAPTRNSLTYAWSEQTADQQWMHDNTLLHLNATQMIPVSQLPDQAKPIVVTGDLISQADANQPALHDSLNKALKTYMSQQWGGAIDEQLSWEWLRSTVILAEYQEPITRTESGYEVTVYRPHYLVDFSPERIELLRPIWRWFVLKSRLITAAYWLGGIVGTLFIVLMAIYLPRRKPAPQMEYA